MNPGALAVRICRGPISVCSEFDFGQILANHVKEKICTVATVSASGQPECALVGFALLPEGKLVLHTHKFSRKWANLGQNPRIALSISSGIYAPYFQIDGIAELHSRGARHEQLEKCYTVEHPKAIAMSDSFATGTILVSPTWYRFFDWPRESGKCEERAVCKAGVEAAATPDIVLRNAYPSQLPEVDALIRGFTGATLPPYDLALIAEDRGDLVAAALLHQSANTDVLVCGPFAKLCRQREQVIAALLTFSQRVINPLRCIVLAAAPDQTVVFRSGFRPIALDLLTPELRVLVGGLVSEFPLFASALQGSGATPSGN